MAIASEFNGFSGGLNPKEPAAAEAEKLFFHGIFALLCCRPAEAFEIFSPLAEHNAAAAFNCALCFLMAKDYDHSLTFLQEAETLLHTFENTRLKQPLPSALLEYEKENNGYRSPMLPDVPKLSPGQALKQTLRVKADVLLALGQTEELKKLLLLLSPEGYENIEKMKKEMRY